MDRLLEQVLVEKSSGFYKEIENLVEEHLISTGHYTRYDRDKPQRSDAQPRSELTKLSDKEVEDIIKEETNKLLEASADEKSQGSDRGSFADTPPPGTSGEVIEVETLIDKESAQTSHILGTNSEAIINLTPESTAGKPGVEMSSSEVSVLKDKTDESMVSKAQNADDISQTDASKGQEIVAQISEPEISNSASSNKEAGQISQKPEMITESHSASTTHDSNLEAMDIDEPRTSNQNTSASQGKLDINISEIERSEDCKPAVEIFQRGDAAIAQASTSEKPDISKGGSEGVDMQAVKPGSELSESKAEIKEANVVEPVENPAAEMKKAKIHKPKVDNSEVIKPEVDVVKLDIAKSGEVKQEIVKPEVTKQKVGKARNPEVDKPKAIKPEVSKTEAGKPKVDEVRKPAIDKAKVVKPEVGNKSKLVNPKVSKAKVGKTKKPAEKTKTNTEKQQRSKESMKPATKESISMPNLFSTDEETDEDLGIPVAKIPVNKPEKSKHEFSVDDSADLSDSDITVSSVHTSDLSSLEDSMSDMEYEDYQELVLKKGKKKESGATTGNKTDESADKETHESGAGTTVKIDVEEKSDGKKSDESDASGSTKVGDESGVGTCGKVDVKEKNAEKDSSVSGKGTTEKSDTKKKKSATDTCNESDMEEERKEKTSDESGEDTSKKIYSEEASEENKSGECSTAVSKDTDGESGEEISKKIDNKKSEEKMLDESGAKSMKIDDDSSEVASEKIDSKDRKLDESDAASDKDGSNVEHDDALQKTGGSRSDSTDKLSPMSDPTLFKPIEPAEPRVFSEPAGSQRSVPAFAQATDDASDADNETTVEESDVRNTKLGKCRYIQVVLSYSIVYYRGI